MINLLKESILDAAKLWSLIFCAVVFVMGAGVLTIWIALWGFATFGSSFLWYVLGGMLLMYLILLYFEITSK